MVAPLIVWFHHDLRLKDNPALHAAASRGPIIPVYCFEAHHHPPAGSAALWWLHHALKDLMQHTQENLCLRVTSDSAVELIQLALQTGARGIYWNASSRPAVRSVEDRLLELVKSTQLIAQRHNEGTLLWNPRQILSATGEPYKVFTPFYRAASHTYPPRTPLPLPPSLVWASAPGERLEKLALVPLNTWYSKLESHWVITAEAAEEQLNTFINHRFSTYAQDRDFPSGNLQGQEFSKILASSHPQNHNSYQQKQSSLPVSTSHLSPYLACGLLSPQQAWHAAEPDHNEASRQRWHTELGWREFANYHLFYFPTLSRCNLKKSFDTFGWQPNALHEKRWRRGLTGYPFVDAGMRQLGSTGFMHNRLRMITASFLVKNLLIPWQVGASWFMRCLVDADEANNSAGWQWVAGCGADAAPYFRIFNPTLQGEKFDPQGLYTRHFVPELKNLPLRYLFEPWKAPASVLSQAGITLGTTYPLPVIDLAFSRQRALNTLKNMSVLLKDTRQF